MSTTEWPDVVGMTWKEAEQRIRNDYPNMTDQETEVLSIEDGTLDKDLKEVYEANGPLILEEDRLGPIQSTYNFPMGNDVSILQLNRFGGEIYNREQRAFKLNLSFGAILQHRETGQYCYFMSYVNNAVFQSPIYISKHIDLRQFYLRLHQLDILDQLLRNRPDTKWIPVLVTNVMFYVTGTNYPLRQSDLPDYLLGKHSLYPLVKNQQNGRPYKDNLCLFRCLALHHRHEIRCINGPAQIFFQQWKLYIRCLATNDLREEIRDKHMVAFSCLDRVMKRIKCPDSLSTQLCRRNSESIPLTDSRHPIILPKNQLFINFTVVHFHYCRNYESGGKFQFWIYDHG